MKTQLYTKEITIIFGPCILCTIQHGEESAEAKIPGMQVLYNLDIADMLRFLVSILEFDCDTVTCTFHFSLFEAGVLWVRCILISLLSGHSSGRY